MSFFFFYTIREQEGRTGPAGMGVGVGTSRRRGGGKRAWEGDYRANTVYTYVNENKRPLETV
jgi:hypothetical protein